MGKFKAMYGINDFLSNIDIGIGRNEHAEGVGFRDSPSYLANLSLPQRSWGEQVLIDGTMGARTDKSEGMRVESATQRPKRLRKFEMRVSQHEVCKMRQAGMPLWLQK